MKETWQDIKGFEGIYQISNKYRVKRLEYYRPTGPGGRQRQYVAESILKPMNHKIGYKYYDLRDKKNGKRKIYFEHRLIGEYFIPNPENKPQINHKDGNKANNKISNLEWVTSSQNIMHSYDAGLQPRTRLNLEKARDIKRRLKNNEAVAQIAEKYGVSKGCIAAIKYNGNWERA